MRLYSKVPTSILLLCFSVYIVNTEYTVDQVKERLTTNTVHTSKLLQQGTKDPETSILTRSILVPQVTNHISGTSQPAQPFTVSDLESRKNTDPVTHKEDKAVSETTISTTIEKVHPPESVLQPKIHSQHFSTPAVSNQMETKQSNELPAPSNVHTIESFRSTAKAIYNRKSTGAAAHRELEDTTKIDRLHTVSPDNGNTRKGFTSKPKSNEKIKHSQQRDYLALIEKVSRTETQEKSDSGSTREPSATQSSNPPVAEIVKPMNVKPVSLKKTGFVKSVAGSGNGAKSILRTSNLLLAFTPTIILAGRLVSN